LPFARRSVTKVVTSGGNPPQAEEDRHMARVAIVTGGTRGIGEAISLALREQGRTVVANYCGNDARAKEFSDRTGIAVAKWDVGDHKACTAGCEQVRQDHGEVDIVVNNAGITRDGTLHRMSWDDWNEVMRVNLGGCFNMAKACFPGMRERKWGRIVNIGSINGQAGQYGQVNYAAAKSGIHGFTKALAQEGAKYGVTVNAIAPGYIDTDMVAAVPEPVLEKIVAKIPVGRLGHANEIARGVAFLTSDEGAFVTGSTMSINGGQHMY
jgi:acetoacetyl-CoA reductase